MANMLRVCAQECAQSGPWTIIPQPTQTNVPIRNGPAIIDFRPVLGSPRTLANRRLQYVSKTLTRNLSIAERKGGSRSSRPRSEDQFNHRLLCLVRRLQ